MKNETKIIIIASVIISFLIFFNVSTYISKRRIEKNITELESRYSDLKESNIELREVKSELEYNNSRNEGILDRLTGISKDFGSEISGARDTIDRLEITVRYFDKIIAEIPG